jgi:hypothetical protein
MPDSTDLERERGITIETQTAANVATAGRPSCCALMRIARAALSSRRDHQRWPCRMVARGAKRPRSELRTGRRAFVSNCHPIN